MPHAHQRRGLTLIELLVVVAVISLLMAIVLPAVRAVKERAKQARCLANLHVIGVGAQSYATEEPRELMIPIHRMMVSRIPASDFWLWRTAIWFSWGGQSAPDLFLADGRKYRLGEGTAWAAATRPLNAYMGGATSGSDSVLDVYRCPSDAGYPESSDIDDAPRTNAGRSLFSTLGNSYRASLYGLFPPDFSDYDGAFSIGVWGHRLSTISDAGQTVAFGEPNFFNMIGIDDGRPDPDPVMTYGWHGEFMVENLLFVDGSARATRAQGQGTFGEQFSQAVGGLGDNWTLISRGSGWRLDLWPTPGARIWSADPSDDYWNPPWTPHGDPGNWPFRNFQDNLRRF